MRAEYYRLEQEGERFIKRVVHNNTPREDMTQDCCSPYCRFWDECNALGIVDYMKIIPNDPRKAIKDWCPSVLVIYPSPPDTEDESPKEL